MLLSSLFKNASYEKIYIVKLSNSFPVAQNISRCLFYLKNDIVSSKHVCLITEAFITLFIVKLNITWKFAIRFAINRNSDLFQNKIIFFYTIISIQFDNKQKSITLCARYFFSFNIIF